VVHSGEGLDGDGDEAHSIADAPDEPHCV
jgi:hypothetical protein